MKMQFLLALAAAVAGGALGAVIAGSRDATPAGDTALLAQVADLDQRLADLAEQNDDLLQKVRLLEDRPVLSEPLRTDPGTPAAVAKLQDDELDSIIKHLQANAQGQIPAENLKSTVGNVLKEIRDEEEKEREARREEQRKERFEQQVQRLAEELGLNYYQTDQMRQTLSDEMARFEKAREEVREAGDWMGMRETFGQIRTETTQRLSTFLTTDQMAKYEESRNDFFGRGPGGRGDGGGRGRGGDGR